MPLLVPHPKCQELPRVYRSPLILEFIMINAKNTQLVSKDTNKILKRLRKRSFYKALKIVSEIDNIIEHLMWLAMWRTTPSPMRCTAHELGQGSR